MTKPLMAGLLAGLLIIPPSPIGLATSGPATSWQSGSTRELAAPLPAYASHAVTLITGDRVSFVHDGTGHGGVAIHRGEGRDEVTFLTQRLGEAHYVIPSDAVPLLAAGQLDRRLFDVALLRESGYHDQRVDLPLIVTADNPAVAEESVPDEGVTVVRDLAAVDGVAVRVEKAEVDGFWEEITDGAEEPAARTLVDGVSAVWLDGLRQPVLDVGVPQVGAPAAWEAGLDGAGVTVAVLDSGIDAAHPDLADRIVGQENFTEDFEDDRDLVGHGTHVASIVAGTGAASDGQYRGVAPGAALLDGKVCVEFGCADSWILAGMQWAAEQGASVVNMSLGGPPFPDDPLVAAVERLTEEFGTLFVVAAGNSGADGVTVDAPGIAESALTVGAVDQDDELAWFSSRGPTSDGVIKPDLTAPGVEIVAANSADGFLGAPEEPYTTLSGTSMATPHAAGAAAILVQQHPDWSAGQLKAALMGSAAPHPELAPYAQGAGRLDVARAIGQAVTTSPASVSFDRPLWPHDDDEPQARTVTYLNDGPDEVVLELAIAATGPDGGPAPDGFFALGGAGVTVPAGGSAEVSLTVDTSVGEVDGLFGGYLTATGPDGLVVVTPFAVDREAESYDVTFVHTDRDGNPTTDYDTVLIGGDPPFQGVSGEPEVTVRVTAGEYFLGSWIWQELGEDQFDTTVLAQPRLDVNSDQTVAVDARLAEPVVIGVDDPAAIRTYTTVDIVYLTDEGSTSFGVAGLTNETIYTGPIGTVTGPMPGLSTAVTGGLAVPTADGDLVASRTVYNLAWVIGGELVAGFARTAQRAGLATVRADHAVQAAGSHGAKAALSGIPDVLTYVWLPMALPHMRTELFNTDGSGQWLSLFDEYVTTGGTVEVISLFEPTSYEAGRTYRQRWNYAVVGPVLPSAFSGVLRFDNELVVVPDLYGDGAGRWGRSPSTGSITVYRDGEVILTEPSSEFAVVEVPPEPASYRVEVEAERQGPSPLSSRTSVAWEFESGHVSDEEEVQLPVSVVRFSPKLAPDNTAQAGRPLLVPVSVQPGPGSDAGQVRRLAVEVSFDDGQTWRRAPVTGGKLLIWHPRGDGFVSLRPTATDTAGNRVEQTIIRAYEFG